MKTILDLLPGGWKGYIGGVLLLVGACGLGADFVGQSVGLDVIADRATTWAEVVAMFGLGLAALGIRHRQDH